MPKIIVEVNGHFGGNGATISEIEVYTMSGTKLSYAINDAYDSVAKSVPLYWNNTSYWGKDRLYNGNITYTSNSSGGASSAFFIAGSSAGNTEWARFSLTVNTNDIEEIRIYAGSPEDRIPYTIKTFIVNDTEYTASMVKSRDDNPAVKLFNEIALTADMTSVRSFSLKQAGLDLMALQYQEKMYTKIGDELNAMPYSESNLLMRGMNGNELYDMDKWIFRKKTIQTPDKVITLSQKPLSIKIQ